MKILHFSKIKNSGAELRVKLEDSDDCWCIYNILAIGDTITAFTSRKVDLIGNNGKCVDKIIKKFNITINVEKFEFNTYDESISISGRNTKELEYIKIGQYHKVEVNSQSTITLLKSVWDEGSDHLFNRAKEKSNETIRAVLLIGEGIAIFYKLTKFITKEVFKVKMNIPKRYRSVANSRHDKSVETFYLQVLKMLCQHLNFDQQHNITIAGPGFTKEGFMNYARENAIKLGFIELHKNLSLFTIQTVSMAARSALAEIPELGPDLSVFNELKKRMGMGSDTFLIGPVRIKQYVESGAIEHLLVTDGFLRCDVVEERKDRLAIVEKVKNLGGKVIIVSDNHYTSDELVRLSGIAALTRYAIS